MMRVCAYGCAYVPVYTHTYTPSNARSWCSETCANKSAEFKEAFSLFDKGTSRGIMHHGIGWHAYRV